MIACPECHSPKHWGWSYCTVCHAAVDCRCCDCDAGATLPPDAFEDDDVC